MNEYVWYLATVGLPLLALAFPALSYLVTGYALRTGEIWSCFTDQTIQLYFRTFLSAEYVEAKGLTDGKEQQLAAELRKQFAIRYKLCCGRGKFVWPLLGLLLTAGTQLALVAWVTADKVRVEASAGDNIDKYLPAIGGFIGAYLWTLYFLIGCMQQRQLSPHDLVWAWFRLVAGVPVAIAAVALFSGALSTSGKFAMALALGAFPTRTLMDILGNAWASRLQQIAAGDGEKNELLSIQGIGRDESARFAEEGVPRVLMLAYSDPIDLTVRTGFPFSYVVDCCSQALALLTFGEQMPKLRRYSIRGAQEICTFVYQLDMNTKQPAPVMKEEQEWALHTLEILAGELSMDQVALRRAFDEIAYDPYTQFLYEVWQPSWN